MNRKRSNLKMMRVAAQTLRVHPEAQRQLNTGKLKKLVEHFDLDKIGVLYAVECEIDGVRAIWIIDGQHRWRALMEHGFGEWIVDVGVYPEGTDTQRAAELFLGLNDRLLVNPYDKFDKEVKAGHEDAIGIVHILSAHGLKVQPFVGDGSVCCVSALKKTYSKDSGAALDKTLSTVISAWGRTAEAVEGKLIEGIGMVYGTYNGTVDQPALVKKLAKYSGGAPALIGDAKGLQRTRKSSLSRCVAEVVIDAYNSGRRAGKLDPL